ncbi:alcohol dehydrogenase [Plectosphaerella cucumerina]|uniref:Alcohol dehydrogenase n=1 Tax=Plectosphaerella cucumerina TaxID=40658 RepID=A0A8K0TRE3_9PEZI|nr:alcohol dehydrogenase [Plectosphaerella cucumerina]
MTDLPSTMRALVAPKHCGPAEYEVVDISVPPIRKPNQILIRIRAASIMTGDCQRARGMPLLKKAEFPLHIGLEGAGEVVAVGAAVARFRPGDEVYGLNFIHGVTFEEPDSGYCAEYALGEEHVFLPKPSHLPWEDAAGLSGPGVTAVQAVQQALKFIGADSLEGKTVFVPGALSGTGFAMVQVAKRMFGATKVISTVSTPKMALVDQLLPGVVDQLIDYQTQNVADVVPRGSVDVVLNTQWGSMTSSFALLKPDTGAYVSLVGVPTSETLKWILGKKAVPFYISCVLDIAQYWYSFLTRGTKIKYKMISGSPGDRESLELMGEAIATGKLKAVYRAIDLEDIDAVRTEAAKIDTGKGGIGRMIVRVRK